MSDIVEKSDAKTKRYSELTKEYVKFIKPLIHPFNFGHKPGYWKDGVEHEHPQPINQKQKIIDSRFGEKPYYYADNRPIYLKKISQTHIQEHLTVDDDGDYFKTYYLTGSREGVALFNIDIDTHSGETEGLAAVELCKEFFPNMYFEPSTNNRGFHGYGIVEYQTVSSINKTYKSLQEWLVMQTSHLDISGIEIKGKILEIGNQHPEGVNMGSWAKLPRTMSLEALEQLKRTWRGSQTDIHVMIHGTPNNTKKKRRDQNCLISTDCCKLHKVLDLSIFEVCPEKTEINKPKRPKNTQLKPSAPARRMASCWEYRKKYHRMPTTQQLLDYIQSNLQYTEPWEYNQAKRVKDTESAIRTVSQVKPKHPDTADYVQLAKEINEGHQITFGDNRKVYWYDLHIWLQILHVLAIEIPNPDGSIPHERFKSLWSNWANKLGYSSSWGDRKHKAIREFMEAMGIINMYDPDWGHKKAMKWSIGPLHPLFGKVKTVRPPNKETLQDGFILDRLAA